MTTIEMKNGSTLNLVESGIGKLTGSGLYLPLTPKGKPNIFFDMFLVFQQRLAKQRIRMMREQIRSCMSVVAYGAMKRQIGTPDDTQ